MLTADCDSTRGPSGRFVTRCFQDAAEILVRYFPDSQVLHVLAGKYLHSSLAL